MTVNLEEISGRLNVPPEELMKRSILSFVAQEIRLAGWEISDIKERYAVSARAELENKIETKEVYSHPAWEDLIHWESLEDYIVRLSSIEEEIRIGL